MKKESMKKKMEKMPQEKLEKVEHGKDKKKSRMAMKVEEKRTKKGMKCKY